MIWDPAARHGGSPDAPDRTLPSSPQQLDGLSEEQEHVIWRSARWAARGLVGKGHSN